MTFLVVCRNEPYGFETLIGAAETRSVPTLDRFKGRKLKAVDTCERAVVVINDELVASGWFSSAEWKSLHSRAQADEVRLLAIRVGLAPCLISEQVALVDLNDARTAIRRFLADQPLQIPRPRIVGDGEDQLALAQVIAQANLGGDLVELLDQAGVDGGTLAVGQVFDNRFRLIKNLGPDALFTNWYTHDLSEGTPALLRFAHAHEQVRAKQVGRALPTWAQVDHPAVAKLLAQGEHQGALWFANSMIGEPMIDGLNAGHVDGDRVLLSVLEVADALAHAHAHGIVHGAVDPQRIYVGRDGRSLITDFGVASITRGSRDAVVYAAPETLAPDATPAVANDVYGLGMVLLLGLNGKPLPYWVLRDANRLIDELRVPDVLSTALRASLDWVPNQRPSSVDALSHALLSDPSIALRLADRALALRRMSIVDRVVACLEEQNNLPSEVSRLRMAVARMRAAEGDPQTAIATLSSLAEQASDPAEVWLEIAAIQQDTDDTAGAIRSCETALEEHQNRRQAIAALRMLLDLDPDRFARWGRTLALYTDGNEKGEVSWRLGKVFHDAGDDASALLWLDRAAAAGHENEDLNRLRKRIRAARGDWTDVVGMMVERSATADDPIAALEAAARIARRATPNPEPLTEIHAKILDLQADHPASLRHLILQATREGASEQALNLLEQLCATDHAEAGDHASHARKLLAAGRWEDALSAVDKALELEPDHIVALRVAGRAAQDGARFERAITHRQRLLELQTTGANSAQADRLARLGDLERFAGHPAAASSHYDAAITISPNHLGAWWGLYVIERGELAEDGSIPPAPLRFGPHEGLARLLADLLDPQSIYNALDLDSFGSALAIEHAAPWRMAAAVVDLLNYREAIGPQLFDGLLDAFPQRIAEIGIVQGLWSGTAHHNGTFPVVDAMAWADDGNDFASNLHRELLFCTTWPVESGLIEARLLEVLFQREHPLEARNQPADLDDDEDLLLESPEVPVLLIGRGASQRQVEVEADLELTPALYTDLPGTLSVFRHGDQIYLSVDEGHLDVDTQQTNELRLKGGHKLSWQGVPIEFYRVQDPSSLGPPSSQETTAKLPEHQQPVLGAISPVQPEVLDPDEPSLVWSSPNGSFGVQLDVGELYIVARPDETLAFSTEPQDNYLAVIMNRGGDCYLEENLSNESGFGGRLSARALIPGESLRFGTHSLIYQAPGKGLLGLSMPTPSARARQPHLILMDGSPGGRAIHINNTPFKLGRGRGCQLQIRTDGLLSRVHCLIEVRDTGHTLRDAGSSNGTRLNGKPVSMTATPLTEGDQIEIGHTVLVFSTQLADDELDLHEDTEETMDQDAVDTRTYLPDMAETVAFDDDSPEVQRKVAITNRALAVLAASLDAIEGPGRTRAELQLLIDAAPKEFQGLFDGIELSSHAIPWDAVDDALADRPERRRIQALSSGLMCLADRMTERVCELLPDEDVDAVLADLAAIQLRRDLQY